jgi:hypothetical protein
MGSRKNFARTTMLAYFASPSATKQKKFYGIATWWTAID